MKRAKTVLICVLSVIIGILLVADSKGNSDTVRRCIDVCLDSLIPSLFCFMAFSAILIQSGIGEILISPLHRIAKYVIRLDKKLFAVFILSQIGGYPVGARLLNDLSAQSQKSSSKYSKAIIYCYNSGPAFVIGIVGIGLYNDMKAGLIIYLSCLAANISAAILMNIRSKCCDSGEDHIIAIHNISVASILVSTAKTMIGVVLPVILFNSLTELADYLLKSTAGVSVPNVIKSVLEITNIKAGEPLPLPISAAFISFGGLCVIYQIFTLARFPLNKLRFITGRIIISAVSACMCALLTMLTDYHPAKSVFLYTADIMISDPLLLICIAGMTFILLSDTGKTNKL